MNKFKKYIVMLTVMMVIGLTNSLQSNGQGNPGDPGCDPLDPACPIDGGLSLLIAAGIGIGAKKAYNAKKKDTSNL
ncbi:MAG: hypothetical protein JST81_09815 [Bacteroidetes bacterium]|nr:hypothetical protein [Bacteroidota bacterium]